MRAIAIALLLAACHSSSAKPDGHIDTPTADAAMGFTLKNYTSWCSVSLGTGMFTTAAIIQNPNEPPGTLMLRAQPATSQFELGPMMWHHTDGDTGSGEAGTVSGGISSATVTIGTTGKCVWVCCPFSPGGTGCPTTDQCP